MPMEIVIGGTKCGIKTRSRDGESRNREMKLLPGGYNYVIIIYNLLPAIGPSSWGASRAHCIAAPRKTRVKVAVFR